MIRARSLAAAMATVCALSLAACSSEGANNSAPSESSTVTVEHAYGSTEVPTDPSNAMSFSYAWTDALATLGHPVQTEVLSETLAGSMPWSTDAAVTTETVAGSSADRFTEFGIEKIAAEEPDVIFAGYVPDQETYDALSQIAPTVATVGEGMVDDWREVTEAAGEVVGDTDGATNAIAEVDATIAAVSEEYPAVAGATFAYAAYGDETFTVIKSPDDAANQFFIDLGMTPAAATMAGQESGRGIAVAPENISTLDMDLLAVWVRDQSPDALAGWENLPSVKKGSAAELDTVAATALGAPTLRSVPWMIRQLDEYFAAL